MAPKRSKGSSSSSATPIPEEGKVRFLYKQLCDKKKWIEAVRADAQNSEFIQCLARTRALLDMLEKQPESKKQPNFLKTALEVYSKLPDGCEQPPGQQLCSLGMLVARASLLQLLAEEKQLEPEQQLAGLACLAALISKGFTRDGWHKVWFDPRSDYLKEEEKSRGNMVTAAAAAAEQLLEAYSKYARVYVPFLTNKDPNIKALLEKLPNVGDIRKQWQDEVNAAKVSTCAW
jgi:hypothetical protein